MKLRCYSVYDAAAKAYLEPFYTKTDQLAQRSFASAAMDPSHSFARHSADYTLFYIGEFDDDDGSFQSSIPLPLGNALTYKAGVQ